MRDPATAFDRLGEAAAGLDAWHAAGAAARVLRAACAATVALRLPTVRRLLAIPLPHALVDPEGRPLGMRLRGGF